MSAIYLIGAVIVLGCLTAAGAMAFIAYRTAKGKRLVTCPENKERVAVEVDAVHAVVSSTLGPVDLRLSTCTRWPERRDCGQECLRQIETAPDGCLVHGLLRDWYAEHSCVFCGRAFGPIESWGHKLALLGPDGTTLEWGEVRTESLPDVLATHKPVCWNCHVAELFRREHPELVIDRPPEKAPAGG